MFLVLITFSAIIIFLNEFLVLSMFKQFTFSATEMTLIISKFTDNLIFGISTLTINFSPVNIWIISELTENHLFSIIPV